MGGEVFSGQTYFPQALIAAAARLKNNFQVEIGAAVRSGPNFVGVCFFPDQMRKTAPDTERARSRTLPPSLPDFTIH